MHSTPFFCVKVVTDIVDSPVSTEEEFLANLGTAAAQLEKAVPMVLDFVAGKTLGEL